MSVSNKLLLRCLLEKNIGMTLSNKTYSVKYWMMLVKGTEGTWIGIMSVAIHTS